jgi:hypothetical protein
MLPETPVLRNECEKKVRNIQTWWLRLPTGEKSWGDVAEGDVCICFIHASEASASLTVETGVN